MIARALPPATHRPLGLHRRSDVLAEPLTIRDRRWWRLKCPVTHRFWQLGDEEFFLWSQLRESISLAELEERFAERFAPQRIDRQQLHDFLGGLHREGLVFSTASGQAETLVARHAKQRRSGARRWLNLLALRLPGIDPSRFLNFLHARVAFVFSRWFLAAAFGLMASALLLVATQAAELQHRLPSANDFFRPGNLVLLMLSLAGAKILHELGHGLTCHHFGGRCHEMGLMLLVFTPCLYCNVSDAWLMPGRGRRMAVSGAGMLVELFLAACATWLWWFSQPGVFASLCLNLMVVCSINTVIFNGNPLLRFDGYFLLSDYLDVPNLRHAADDWLQRWGSRIVLGTRGSQKLSRMNDRPWLVGTYAVMSLAYRAVLTVTVAWFVVEWFRANQLAAIGIGLVLMSGGMWMAQTIWKGSRTAREAWRRRELRAGRAAVTLVVFLAGAGALSLIPVPRHLRAPAVIRPATATTVYAAWPGTLVQAVSAGERVAAGDTIAILRNDDLEAQWVKLIGDRDAVHQQLVSRTRSKTQSDPSAARLAAAQIPTLEKQLASLQSQVEQKQADRERLVVRAPIAGEVVRVAEREREARDGTAGWIGSPLDPENRGCFLDAGVALCLIRATDEVEAWVAMDQSEVRHVEPGQSVSIAVDELPHRTLEGKVQRLDSLVAEEVPPELVAKRLVPISSTTGTAEPLVTSYHVIVSLPSTPAVVLGASGMAKVHVDSQTVPRRLYEWFWQTFR